MWKLWRYAKKFFSWMPNNLEIDVISQILTLEAVASNGFWSNEDPS